MLESQSNAQKNSDSSLVSNENLSQKIPSSAELSNLGYMYWVVPLRVHLLYSCNKWNL